MCIYPGVFVRYHLWLSELNGRASRFRQVNQREKQILDINPMLFNSILRKRAVYIYVYMQMNQVASNCLKTENVCFEVGSM